MAESHPSRQDLELFLRGQLPGDRLGRVVGHLLTDCPNCQEVTGKSWARVLEGLRAGRNDLAPNRSRESSSQAESDYSLALSRAIGHAAQAAGEIEHQYAVAESLYEELLNHPPNRRLTLVKNSPRFRSPELCQVLMERGFEQRFSDPQQGIELTELAVAVGAQLPDEVLGPRETRDLVGRAWAYHGNALRVATDLRQAERAFREAELSFSEGLGGDLDKALLCRFTALLLRARRGFAEAHSRQDRAIRLYLRHGETRIAAQVLGDQALGMIYAGEAERAYPKLERALEIFVDLAQDRDAAMVRHNLVFCLTEMGRHEKALELAAAVRPAIEELGDSVSLIRLRWLEGRILHALGRDSHAEAALIEAREAFVEEAIGYDAALVCLDLATVYARQGRTVEIRGLAESMLPIFQSRDVHREAIAALIVFREAALAETATLAMVEQVSQYLRVARDDPKRRLELS